MPWHGAWIETLYSFKLLIILYNLNYFYKQLTRRFAAAKRKETLTFVIKSVEHVEHYFIIF